MWGIRRPRPQVGLLRLPGQWCIGGDGDGGGRLDSGSCYCCSSEHHLHHHSRLLDCEGEEEEEGRRQHRTWGRTRKPCRIASSFPESKCEDPKLSNHTQHLSVTSGTVSEEHEKSRSSCFRSRRCHLTREDIEKCSPGDKEEQCCEKQKREMDDAVSVQGGDNDSELPRNPWKILSVAIHTSPPGDTSDSLGSRRPRQREQPQSSSKSAGSKSRASEYAISFRNSQSFPLGDPLMVEPQKRQSNSAHVYETPEEFAAGGTDNDTHPAVPVSSSSSSSPATSTPTPTSPPHPQSAPESDTGKAAVGRGERRGSEGPLTSARGETRPTSSSSACTTPPEGRSTGSPVVQSPLGGSSIDSSSSSSGRKSPRRMSGTAPEGRGRALGEREDQRQTGGGGSSAPAIASSSSSSLSGTLLTPEGNHTRGGMELRATSVSDDMSMMRGQGTAGGGGGRGGEEREGSERRRQHLAGRFARLLGPQLASEESNATTAETTAPSPSSSRPLPVLRPLRGGGRICRRDRGISTKYD